MRTKADKTIRGITLAELVVVIAILSLLTFAAAEFQRSVFSLNSNIQGSLNAQLSARAALREFSSEVRSAAPSSLGAFPIAGAESDSLIFYSDIDGDGDRERVRYYLDGDEFKKGVIAPSGSPIEYDPDDEDTEMVISDIANGTVPVFEYFDGKYDGTTEPLEDYSNSDVRLVKLTLMIDDDPNRAPDAYVLSTQVSIRNLKDNL